MRPRSTSGPEDSPARAAIRRVRRAVLTHRRLVAAVCTVLAVATGLTALRPPAPETAPVVVTSRDIDSGATLQADDVEVRDVRPDATAAHAYARPDEVIGEVVAAPMRRGEAVTDMRILASGLLDGYPGDSTIVTVRIADPQSLWGVEVGSVVDIVGVDVDGKGAGEVVAAGAQVVAMPSVDTDDPAVSTGAVLVVSVPTDTAVSLTDASSRMQLGVVVAEQPMDSSDSS